MAKWTDYFKIIAPKPETVRVTDNQGDMGAYNNYSWYQHLVQGSASRLTKYREYELMDNDVEVARALDTIAEEMTGNNPKTDRPIEIDILSEDEDEISTSTVLTLQAAVRRWSSIHDWDNKLFNVSRFLVKYGDCFFKRSKDNFSRWEFIHPKDVMAAIVDKDNVNNILFWQIRKNSNSATPSYGVPIGGKAGYETETIPANLLIRFTLNDDMSDSAPFGESILRPVYRSHKQKELLEDAVIIYRIQRAPERRVFYIDVGKMPPQRVKMHLEQIKNEIKQKKIPTNFGGTDQVDSVYNPHSMSEDFYFACISLETKIFLLDGRTLTLNEIIDEFKQGKENWVYSVDQKTGKFIPGLINWAGITRRNTQVVKVHLDNDETIICTPDHKFITCNGEEIQAQELTSDLELMTHELDTHNHKVVKIEWLSNTQDTGCISVVDPGNNHNFAIESGVYIKNSRPDGRGSRVETLPGGCLDLNTEIPLLDGRILTLEQMIEEHQQGKQNWIYSVNPQSGEITPGIVSWAGVTHENAETFEIEFDNNEKIICTSDHKFPVWGKGKVSASELQIDDSIISLVDEAKTNTKINKQISEYNLSKSKTLKTSIIDSKQTMFSKDMIIIIKYLFDEGYNEKSLLVDKLNLTEEFMDLWLLLNPNYVPWFKNLQIILTGSFNIFKFDHLDALLNVYGYNSWDDFKQQRTMLFEIEQEDRSTRNKETIDIISIRKLPGTRKVGTLTIDQDEQYHNYHTFALNAGVFTYNSGLGQLDDLMYFQKKVWNGLRVPTSYMMDQAEGGALYNDNKVGVAYIQEIRFTQFILRLQGYIESALDKEFKRFLHSLNVHIDESMFKLSLPEPSNFARYRQQEIDNAALTAIGTADGISYLSKRFILKRYLQLTDDEIISNEGMMAEEKGIDPDMKQEKLTIKIYGNAEDAGDAFASGGGAGSDLIGGAETPSEAAEPTSPTAPGGEGEIEI